MKAEITKWYMNADSPVTLMIDDLANVYIDSNGNGIIDIEEDCGFLREEENSTYKFLNDNLIKNYPKIKITFFVPVNKKPMIENSGIQTHFGPINENTDISNFFKKIHQLENCELAYHGYTHGIGSNGERKYVQEWLSYKDLNEALETIKKGRNLFYEVTGEYPAGGKYCGYVSNGFSDESIEKSGFFWWCRYYDREKTPFKGKSKFLPRYFGSQKVIDIPSTIAGNVFNISFKSKIKTFIKVYLKRKLLLYENIFLSGYEQIDRLLRKKHVVSIQEHISPARTDGKRQILNIFDDMESLKKIFDYLSDKNVWYATCTQIAQYYEIYTNSSLEIVNETLNFSYNGRKFCEIEATILFLRVKKNFILISQNGKKYHPIKVLANSCLFNLPPETSKYKIVYE